MKNTLFSCTTCDPAQLAWMQLALTHFGSENSGPNSSMATMENRRGGLLWPVPLLQDSSSLAFAILTIPHLFCRISFHANSVSSSRNLLHCFPTTSTKRFSPLSGFPMLQLMLSAQMFPAPSGAVPLHQTQSFQSHLFAKGQHETQPVIQFAPPLPPFLQLV